LSFPSRKIALLLLSKKCSRKFVIQKQNDNEEHIERMEPSVQLIILNRTFEDNVEKWDNECIIEVQRNCLYSNMDVIGSSHMQLFDSCNLDTSALYVIIGSVIECFQLDTKHGQMLKSRFGVTFHLLKLQLLVQNKWNVTENKRFIGDAQPSNDFAKYVTLGSDDDILIVSQSQMKYSNVEDIYFIGLGMFFCIMVILSIFIIIGCDNKEANTEEIMLLAQLNDEPTIDKDDLMEVEQDETEAIRQAEFTKAVFDEYENCDLQDSASVLVLTRFDCKTGQILNEFDISTQQWLFSVPNYSTDNRFPFFIMRHDVDAFIYEPQTVFTNSNDIKQFQVKHLDSFPAFGYVYASKQNRRFMTFCPEVSKQKTLFNYAVIDNWIDQMLYVYCKSSQTESAQQTSDSKPNTGQQFLFHFGQNEVKSKDNRSLIYGLCALPHFTDFNEPNHKWNGAVYILTDEKLHLIRF